jgi:hypothetical protein
MKTIAWLTREDVPYSLTVTAELFRKEVLLEFWADYPNIRVWAGNYTIGLKRLARVLEEQPRVIKLGALRIEPNKGGDMSRAVLKHSLLGEWRGTASLGRLAELLLQATLGDGV